MRTGALTTLAIVAGLLLGIHAQAQQPSSSEPPGRNVALPAAPPPEYGPPLNIEQAKTAADAAIAEAKKNNWHMAISIVGPKASWSISRRWTARRVRPPCWPRPRRAPRRCSAGPARPSWTNLAAGNQAFLTFPDAARPIASEGGVPIILNGKLVGAIGISGGTAQQDGVAATAGASAVK